MATALRAIHAPERCLSGAGHHVLDARTVDVDGVPVRRLVLDGGGALGLSFLVSRDDGVDENDVVYASGLADVAAARVAGHRAPWVFVSAVVDSASVTDERALVIQLKTTALQLLSPHPVSSPFPVRSSGAVP